jgi:formate dehydrogenase major subunit
MSKKVNIILNGEHITAREDDYVLNVARENNIEIPTLCNDPRLEPFSSCFVCVVEVENMRGLQPSCSTRVQEGMVINTDNEKVRKSRQSALELIMSNHYADCVAPCTETCPANVDVQGYISLIDKGLYHEAVALIKRDNPLPAICGRVCVRPCEAACNRNEMDEATPVGIDYMKRFVSDYDLMSDNHYVPELAVPTGKKVAIIGAGPGGLSASTFLSIKGHKCDIFEAAPEPGGWLRYGIPEYRLPNDLLQREINTVTELGTRIFCNSKLGENIHFKDLQEKYDSIILAIGSQKGTLVGVKGDEAENVFSGINFLKNLEITKNKPNFAGKKVVVVGGGNTAMDCCRTAIRLGSTDVKVVYRRTEKEMPANPIEIHESKLEGVEYLFLHNPIEVNQDEDGELKSLTLIKMELGEPDASGRRRPIPKPGTEFEIEADYVLAAIGQQTDVHFIDEVNSVCKEGELRLDKWGNISVNRDTLQTGVPFLFAAGDGVTGAATIIEAIAQAKIAANSCHSFMMGEEVKPPKKAFVSLRSNFDNYNNDNFKNTFPKQERIEMPVMDESQRVNFKEVELGYSEEMCRTEASRCMECGCGEFFDCDLQKYSDEYNVDQKKYAGDFNEYQVDFSHPYIEIDNNKCILCSRCIRICDEIVGANALGLVNRGFATYVAPSLGGSLSETNCQSCGLCIDTCPTGAIRENLIFKPGPVSTEPLFAIDNYGSEGVAMNLMTHKNKFVMEVQGAKGLVNPLKTIGHRAKFGYHYLNDDSRITTPLLKVDGEFQEISFKDAFSIIARKIKKSKPEKTALFAGARLTNEELYLLQNIARNAIHTPYIADFHYLGRGAKKYANNAIANVPFSQIKDASTIFILGADLIYEHDYVGFLVNEARKRNNVKVHYIADVVDNMMARKADHITKVKDYFAFVKALNYYFIENNYQNQMFVESRTEGYDEYKQNLLSQDFETLLSQSGLSINELQEFANSYNNEINAILIFSEKQCSGDISLELYNLAMITGKLSKTASGLIPLKEKNNSQGIFDMGAFPCIELGGLFNDFKPNKMLIPALKDGDFENILIFGEDPIGTALNKDDVSQWFEKQEFMLVQDSFMTETAKMADLILPASFPIESAGSFTNTQRIIQQFDKQVEAPFRTNFEQLSCLGAHFGLKEYQTVDEAFMEFVSLLPKSKKEVFKFKISDDNSKQRRFDYGADYLMMRFDKEFFGEINV